MSGGAGNATSRDDNQSISGVLQHRAKRQPEQSAYRFLLDDGVSFEEVSYRELDESARKIGAWLRSRGAARQPVPLIFPAGLDFVRAFLGCLYAGSVAVPLNLPGLSEGVERILSVFSEIHPKIVIGSDAALSRLSRGVARRSLHVECEFTPLSIAIDADAESQGYSLSSEDLAILQFTSGSTSMPKGVEISHGNLLHNVRLMSEAVCATPQSRGVSWLPHFHDMGLIGGIVMPLVVGFPVTLMSPASFMRRPVRWLEAISRAAATISGGPNFGYEHCLRHVDEQDLRGLDLSSWRTAFSGAESIRIDTISRFCAKFEGVGFKKSSLFPCYGLAEATLMVSGQHWDEQCEGSFSSSLLERGLVEQAREGQVRTLASSGAILKEHDVRIVDPQTMQACSAGAVGEVWINSQSVGRGYWRRPQESASTFSAHVEGVSKAFLRTGDLGFVWRDQLFIVGRQKDLLIIKGSNFYPQDIEMALEAAIPALRRGVGAAFAIEREQDERLVVVYELDRDTEQGVADVFTSARSVLAEAFGLQAEAIVLVKRNKIPRTTSGKVKRQQCKAEFLAGGLHIISEWQNAPGEHRVTAAPSISSALQSPVSTSSVAIVLREQLADLLGVEVATIDEKASIYSLGVDSLVAVRLQNRLEQSLNVRLEVARLLEAKTLEDIIRELVGQVNDRQRPPLNHVVNGLFEHVSRLSDEEVAHLLALEESREWAERP